MAPGEKKIFKNYKIHRIKRTEPYRMIKTTREGTTPQLKTSTGG